jgi:hypothetical protein
VAELARERVEHVVERLEAAGSPARADAPAGGAGSMPSFSVTSSTFGRLK